MCELRLCLQQPQISRFWPRCAARQPLIAEDAPTLLSLQSVCSLPAAIVLYVPRSGTVRRNNITPCSRNAILVLQQLEISVWNYPFRPSRVARNGPRSGMSCVSKPRQAPNGATLASQLQGRPVDRSIPGVPVSNPFRSAPCHLSRPARTVVIPHPECHPLCHRYQDLFERNNIV
jgi:hypothetical protein